MPAQRRSLQDDHLPYNSDDQHQQDPAHHNLHAKPSLHLDSKQPLQHQERDKDINLEEEKIEACQDGDETEDEDDEGNTTWLLSFFRSRVFDTHTHTHTPLVT